MTEYSLSTLPSFAGIYMLRNQQAREIYFGEAGNLNQRFLDWRQHIRGSTPARSKILREAFERSKPEDWKFVVVKEMPGSTVDERWRAEQTFISTADETGEYTILNTRRSSLPAIIQPFNQPEGDVRAFTIIHEGRNLTYREAGHLLGISKLAVRGRALRLRDKGRTELTLADLQNTPESNSDL